MAVGLVTGLLGPNGIRNRVESHRAFASVVGSLGLFSRTCCFYAPSFCGSPALVAPFGAAKSSWARSCLFWRAPLRCVF